MSDSWAWTTLGEVFVKQPNKKVIQQGWSPKCHRFPAAGGEWGVLKTTAIQAGSFEPEHNKQLPDGLVPRPNIEVRAGDLLMTCAGPRARCGVPTLVRHTPDRLMMSGKMYRFRPDDRLDSRFLELWLLSPEAQKRIDAMKTGISDSGLNLTHGRFVQLPVPLPPLDEQHRIVEILEDHLSRLAAAEVGLRQAHLRLRALERSALDVCFGVGDGGVALSEIVEGITAGKSFGGADAPARDGEWGIVKVSSMTWGEFRPEENKAVTGDRVDPRYEIREGDLLVSRANTSEYVGASVLVGPVRPKLLLSDKSLRLQPRSGVCSEWLWRALQAPSARSQISGLATGTKDSMRNISQGSLLKVRVPDADPDAQADALRRFHRMTSLVRPTRVALASAQHRSDGLRRSLLAAAFSGRLTDGGSGVEGTRRDAG